MLPTEAFADAVAFLSLFDLKALAVTNAMCSSLAVSASARIRWEQFPGLHFYLCNQQIEIFRAAKASKDASDPRKLQFVALLTFPSEDEMIEFIDDTLPYCVFEDMTIFRFISQRIVDAVGRAAQYVVVYGALHLDVPFYHKEALNLGRRFRKVKALQYVFTRDERGDKVNELASFYRGSGVQEFWYRSYRYSTLKRIMLS